MEQRAERRHGYGDDRYSTGSYPRGGGDGRDREGRGFTGRDVITAAIVDATSRRSRARAMRQWVPAAGLRLLDRGFIDRAGDEVRSWFGDEEAERRREADARHDERVGGTRDTHHHDRDYHDRCNQQIAAFDRDHAEYRQHNRSKFHTNFSSWRTQRQGQRDQLTKSDADAGGGRHHSVPSSWIQLVEGKVTLARTAAEAKKQWRDEERSGAMFGGGQDGDRAQGDDRQTGAPDTGRTDLNRSFSGTY